MQDVRVDRSIEDEIIFQTYGITGYRNPDAGVCDDTTCAGADDNPGSDGGEGLGTLEGQHNLRPGSD